MTRTEFSRAVKGAAALRAAGHCEQCTRKLLSGDFHFDHIIPDGLGGPATLDNCKVVCRACHGKKTASQDVPRIAKMKRQRNKHIGIKKPPTLRDPRFKRKLNGQVVFRASGELA